MTTTIPPAWQAHAAGLDFLTAPGLHITTATIITGPCERCGEQLAVIRVYGQPHPDFDHPVECEEVCAGCGPWVVSSALQQQVPWSDRPIQVEIQVPSSSGSGSRVGRPR